MDSDLKLLIASLSDVLDKFTCFKCFNMDHNTNKRLRTCNHFLCEQCLAKQSKCPCLVKYATDDVVDHNIGEFYNFIDDIKSIIKPATQEKVTNYGDTIILPDTTQFQIVYLENNYKPRRNKNGEVPLHVACKTKAPDKVTDLCNKNHNLNEKDFAGWAPLHEAVLAESFDCCKFLLKNGALVNTPGPEYTTPLHKAVETGNLNIIKLLISFGASLDAIDYDGKKPCDYTNNKKILHILKNTEATMKTTLKVYIPTKLVIYCHSIDEQYKDILREIPKITITEKFTPKSTQYTHFIIKKTHKLSVKILIAIVSGLLFLTQEDILNLHHPLDHKKLLAQNYINNEILNTTIHKSIINKLLNGPKLFDGCSFFLMHKKSTSIYSISVDESFLKYIIELGGGQMHHRMPTIGDKDTPHKYPYHTDKTSDFAFCCEYVVYNEENAPLLQYKTQHLKHVSSKWLINCVLLFSISDHSNFKYIYTT